ncbi:hypothetical protein Glove_109g278 [Diversispora epigaea]|uniref:Cysteine dioxygenase n=1 Tax=Diversispora epigaea TaxID=1348612 RepID=A0A397JBG3_9GLOM|nr:hypothetical protein Glove_109g278 [Diversispora epigaea]
MNDVFQKSSMEVENTVATIKSFKELINSLRKELGVGGLDSDGININRIVSLMSSYISNESDWIEYVTYNNTTYTKNLVDNGNSKFNLIVMGWDYGVASSFWQLGRVAVSMAQRNVSTDFINDTLSDEAGQANDIQPRPDKIGVHKVFNPSTAQRAVSLHLYTPPYTTFKTFDESTSEIRTIGPAIRLHEKK